MLVTATKFDHLDYRILDIRRILRVVAFQAQSLEPASVRSRHDTSSSFIPNLPSLYRNISIDIPFNSGAQLIRRPSLTLGTLETQKQAHTMRYNLLSLWR